MENTYRSKHKCRLCGKVYESGAVTGNVYLAICSIIEMDKNMHTIMQAPTLIDVHRCENGNIGCADFIGWEKEQTIQNTQNNA